MFTTPSKKIDELRNDMALLRAKLQDLRELYQRLNEALGGALNRIEQLEGKKTLSHFSKR